MMKKIFLIIVFLYATMPAWANNIGATTESSPIVTSSEEIILFDPNEEQQRFINIKKRPGSNINIKKNSNIFLENQSFQIIESVNEHNQFNMKLKYDDSGLYTSKYKRIDELKVETKGEINDKLDYRVNIVGNNIHSDSDNQQVHTNSYIGAKLNKTHKLYLGGSRLSETTENKIDFLKDVENSYGKDDMGGKLQGRLEKFDYSMGAYKDMHQNDSYSKGAVAAFKPFGEKSKLGHWSIGSAYYSKAQQSNSDETYGAFSYYRYKNFGIKNEYARHYVGSSDNYNTNWSFSPEYYISKNLALKTKHKQWYQSTGYANDFILEYSVNKPKLLRINNLKLQLKASYIKGFDEEESRRVGFNSIFGF